MKRKLIQAVLGVALASSASAAMAFLPSNSAPDYTVFISGSSAVSSTVRDYTIDSICDSSNGNKIDVFRTWDTSKTPPTFTDDWGVACKIQGSKLSTSGNSNVLFLKRDAGGSGWGVTPVTNQLPADVIDTSTPTAAGNGNCSTAPTAQTTANGTSYNLYKCGTAKVSHVPEAGFSDVEPTKFNGINTPPGLTPFDPTTAAPYTAEPVAALTFGIPVSLNLRNALQVVQFPGNSSCNPNSSTYTTATAESDACMPSLTPSEISTLFVGGMPDWSQYMVTDPSSTTGKLIPITQRSDVQQFLGTDTLVQICRRTPGSGTQATLGIEFLNAPCDPKALPPLRAPGALFGGPKVAENSGSSDLGNCLNDFSTGQNSSGQNANGAKRWAIGLQFTTKNVGLSKAWRFIKVNGVAPTIQNVAKGDWPYYAEESYQYRTDTASYATDLTNGNSTYAGDTKKILAYIGANAVTPPVLSSINSAYHYPFGDGGWLAIPGATATTGYHSSNPFSTSNPVNTSTRSPFGNPPNTCQLPITIDKVQVDGPF